MAKAACWASVSYTHLDVYKRQLHRWQPSLQSGQRDHQLDEKDSKGAAPPVCAVVPIPGQDFRQMCKRDRQIF